MAQPSPIRSRPCEEGFILIAVIFLLFLLALSLTIAAPKIARAIQRDRDKETMERGKQYLRAIQLYYRKFNAYPPTLDALVQTDNIRFLRKKYKDPITGKDDWQPIFYGQNKAPIAMGFFGQPLGGMGGVTPMGGVGPGGGNAAPGAPGATNTGFGSSSGLGSSFGSGFGSSTGGSFGSSTGGSSLFGSSSTGTSTGATTSPTGASGGASGASGGTGTDSGGGSSSGSGTGFGGGQSFGGLGIIGFRPASPKKSILVYKGKDHYNQWEFTYSPLMDMQTMPGAAGGAAGQPPTGTTNTNTNSGFGNSGFGSSGFGGSSSGGSSFGSGFGNSSFGGSSPSTSPTTQQQP